MYQSSVERKIRRFVQHIERQYKNATLEKLQGPRTRKLVDRFTSGKSRGGSRIYVAEVLQIWKHGLLNMTDKRISQRDIKDMVRLVASDALTSRAKYVLVRRMVMFLEKTYAERLNLMQSEVHIATAVSVLRKFAASRFQGFNLRHGGRLFGYRPRHFMMVSNMIGRGDVEFMLKPTLPRKKGVYRSDKNSISVVHSQGQGWYSTLIHEATHAIQDMYNLGGTVGDYEVGAHITQAAYLMIVGGQPPENSRIAQAPVVAEAVSAVVLDRPGDVLGVIHKDIIKVIRNGGYGDKVDKPVKQNVFDPKNFLDLWVRI